MKDFTVIIPIKELKDETELSLLEKAISSIGDNDALLVGPKNELDKVKDKKIKKLINDSDNLDYQHQVNMAVENIESKYFSVLEFDDYFSDTWFNNVEKYISVDTEDISCFLPLTEIVDYKENKVIGYANEVFWASAFSEEIGYPDMESMLNYLNFNTSGAIFKKDDFISVGGLKESMKLVFWYEYLLRLLYNNKIIFVIPKVGYYHIVNRDGSLSDMYRQTIEEKEANWLVDLAKKEYYFKKDRNKVYEEE
jgi:hypothetical protein